MDWPRALDALRQRFHPTHCEVFAGAFPQSYYWSDAAGLKAYRPVTSDPEGTKQWPRLRKRVADLHRRCELSQAANTRDLEALGAVEATTPLERLSAPLCRAVVQDGRRDRALNPLSDEDAAVLEGVQRGEHLISGFRNRDLRQILYGARPPDVAAYRRQSRRVGRLLALLRAPGLIKKVPKTHRYYPGKKVGRTILSDSPGLSDRIVRPTGGSSLPG